MPLETGTYISDLNQNNPVGATDGKQRGDDHIRLVKKTILNTFPSVTGAITLTHTQINNAAIKTEANVFTGQVSLDEVLLQQDADNSVAAQKLYSLRDHLNVEQWSLNIDTADSLYWTDVVNGQIPLQFKNNESVRIRDGLALRIYDSTDTDYIQLSHNGTNAVLEDGSGTAALNIDNMNVYIRNGSGFRVYDPTNADYMEVLHTGTNINANFIGTTNFNIIGLSAAGYFQIQDGAAIRVFDSTDTDYIRMNDTGSEAQILTNNNAIHLYPSLTEVARISSTLFDLRGGENLRVRDATNADYWNVRHDGTDAIFDHQGTGWLRLDGLTFGVQLYDGGTMRILDSTNSDYIDISHDGTDANIDFAGTTELNINGPINSPNASAAEAGFKGAPVNVQNANYTLALTDAAKTVRKESGGAGETYTIPANASVAFPIGTIIEIQNDGGGDLSIAITTDTLEEWGTGNTGTRTLPDNNKAIIEKSTATLWKYSATG